MIHSTIQQHTYTHTAREELQFYFPFNFYATSTTMWIQGKQQQQKPYIDRQIREH